MPPVAAIAVGVLASAPIWGAAGVGLATYIGGGIAAAGILDATAAGIVGGALTGAAVGATGAAITGGDPGQGALFGGLSGGLTTGLSPEVQGITGLPTDASQAITTAGVTDALRLAQGQSLGAATEAGLISGAGSYAGSQLKNFINQQTALTPGASSGGGNDGLSPVQVTPQTQLPGTENVTVGANAPASPDVSGATSGALPVEKVEVTGQRQSPSQSDLNLAQAINFSGNVLGKTAIGAGQYGLDALLGGSSYYQPSAGSGSDPGGSTSSSSAPGGATIGGAAPGSSTNSPGSAQAAAAGQSGQAGSSSVYAPGSPIFGDNGSVTKPGVWNTASLRTPQAEGA